MKKIGVEKVQDGDTFKAPRDQFFCLAEVHAPKKGERGYKKAKETLQDL